MKYLDYSVFNPKTVVFDSKTGVSNIPHFFRNSEIPILTQYADLRNIYGIKCLPIFEKVQNSEFSVFHRALALTSDHENMNRKFKIITSILG